MHPFERWFASSLGALFGASLALTLVVGAALGTIDASLHVPTAPQGIVSFELVGASGVAALLEGWTEAQRRDAALVQGLDYFFLVLYSTALASGALLLARRHAARPQLAALARPVAWAFTLAALADAIENTPMTLMLRAGVASPGGADLAQAFALLKFALLAIGLLWTIVALLTPRAPA